MDHDIVSSLPQPVYMDGLCKDPDPIAEMPCHSLHSPSNSFSSSISASSGLESAYLPSMPAHEDVSCERFSIRSKKSFFRPRRLRWAAVFSRPSTGNLALERSRSCSVSASVPIDETAQSSIPSVLKNKSSFPPLRGAKAYAKRPLPQLPCTLAPPRELTCERCYYFAARNCNGWVLGGSTGDACEGCLQAGFFGAK